MNYVYNKAYIVSFKNAKKKKKSPFNFLAKPRYSKKKYRQESNNFNPIPATSTAALVLKLLACNCGSTKQLCRRNGNCVNPYHTDSYGGG